MLSFRAPIMHWSQVDSWDESRQYRDFIPVRSKDLRLIAHVMLTRVWCPVVYRAGYRCEDNYLSASVIPLDFDCGWSLEQVSNNLCDMQHIIGTTRSHTPEYNRFRVLLLLPEPCYDLRAYRATCAKWISFYDADPSCKDGARFFWPCREIISVCQTGDFVELVTPPIAALETTPLGHSCQGAGPWLSSQISLIVPKGQRNSVFYAYGCKGAEEGMDRIDMINYAKSNPTWLLADRTERGELTRSIVRGWERTALKRAV